MTVLCKRILLEAVTGIVTSFRNGATMGFFCDSGTGWRHVLSLTAPRKKTESHVPVTRARKLPATAPGCECRCAMASASIRAGSSGSLARMRATCACAPREALSGVKPVSYR